MAQDVGHRLRKNSLLARDVQITVKDYDYRQYQMPLKYPTRSPLEIAQAGYALFRHHYGWHKTMRALTIRGINLTPENRPIQLGMFDDYAARAKRQALDDAIDEVRCRFGYGAIRAASLISELSMAQDKCETVMMPAVMYQ